MRVETTNAVQVAKNVITATAEPSGNWYPQLWLCVSACQNARSAWFPSQSADRGYCCCSRCHKWGGMCVPRCPHQCRFGIRHYTGSCHGLCQLPCRQPDGQQPNLCICTEHPPCEHQGDLCWPPVLCNLAGQGVCRSAWAGHPQGALAGKQTHNSQDLGAVGPCREWQAHDREPRVCLHYSDSLVAIA